jgi:DNA modification methylase
LGIPEMVKRALMEDGWICRSTIIWHKPNPMPESVRDRPTKAHEYLFLLSKSERYFYDADAVREPKSPTGKPWGSKRLATVDHDGRSNSANTGGINREGKDPGEYWGQGRNRRSVWTVATRPFRGAHFATFPPKLIEPCILAGTSEAGCCPECGTPWERVVERSARRFGQPPG